MKTTKLILAGLMALMMTSLSSCLGNGGDDDNRTWDLYEFMDLIENGKILRNDNGYTFTMSNFTEFSNAIKNPGSRRFMYLQVELEPGMTLEDAYKKGFYPVTHVGSADVLMGTVTKEATPNKKVGSPQILATKLFLNAILYAKVASTPKSDDLQACVTGRRGDGTIMVDIYNNTPTESTEASWRDVAVSFPMVELLSGIDSPYDNDGCMKIEIDGTTYKVYRDNPDK